MSAIRSSNGHVQSRNGLSTRTNQEPAIVRCAVYTRKSVSDRFEQNVSTLLAQRDAGVAYVQSQREKGWSVLPERYDDDGFTGANIERPSFQRLLRDIDRGLIDVIVIHRFDRISRSQKDFIWILDFFRQRDVQFVSVNETFDTSTPFGECMLSILVAFSQLERRVIAERTKQKMLATRQRGHWTGGPTPLGYDIKDKRLVVNKIEAAVVRNAFETFVKTESIIKVLDSLNDRGVRTKRGKAFDRATLWRILANPIYAGRMRAGDEIVEGEHEAIVDVQTWEQAQEILEGNKRKRTPKRASESLLAGLLRCGRYGSAMSPTHTKRGNKQYHYYKCQSVERRGAGACPGARIPAAGIERIVIDKIKAIGQDHGLVEATITAVRQRIDEEAADLDRRLADLFARQEDLIGRRRKALDGLDGSGNARPMHEALGEITAGLDRVESEMREVRDEREALGRVGVDEQELRTTLLSFSKVWDELFPRERGRIVQKLVDEVTYSAETDEVEIRFKPEGFALIAAKASS